MKTFTINLILIFIFFMSSSAKSINKINTKADATISVSEKSIRYKISIDKNQLSKIYAIIKNEFKSLPELKDDKLFYKEHGINYTLKIKIKPNKLSIRYKSEKDENPEIQNKISHIKESINNL